MKRRAFIALLGGAAVAWPLAARAQQPPMPVVGVLHGGWGLHHGSPDVTAWLRAAIHRGLKETGFVEDHNVRIEYRWAEDHYDRLPQLAADLARRQVAVIIANTPTMLAARRRARRFPLSS
jgi:putative ABC transport system substrate-binding protein